MKQKLRLTPEAKAITWRTVPVVVRELHSAADKVSPCQPCLMKQMNLNTEFSEISVNMNDVVNSAARVAKTASAK